MIKTTAVEPVRFAARRVRPIVQSVVRPGERAVDPPTSTAAGCFCLTGGEKDPGETGELLDRPSHQDDHIVPIGRVHQNATAPPAPNGKWRGGSPSPNIFLGGDPTLAYGPTSHAGAAIRLWHRGIRRTPGFGGAYLALVADPTRGDHQRFMDVKQPVLIRDNVYAAGATAYEAEKGAIVLTGRDATAAIVDEGAEVYLQCQLPVAFDNVRVDSIGGADLERVRFVDADFEGPDGTPALLGADLVGVDKAPTSSYPAGPIIALASGSSRIRRRCC